MNAHPPPAPARRETSRHEGDHGWLDTFHTFSFSRYIDRSHMGYRSLRVINEDFVAPGMGFGEHPHEDMEIITYIVSGQLAHKDSTGNAETINPGDIQYMSAGSGIFHSEFNPSKSAPVHLLQIWILPEKRDLAPRYDQKHFAPETRRNVLRLVASHDGRGGSIRVQQDVSLYASLLDAGRTLTHTLGDGRGAWLQLIKGELRVNDQALTPGDGIAVENEPALNITASQDAEFLLFDLA